MKRFKTIFPGILLLALIGAGCAKKGAQTPDPVVTPPVTNPATGTNAPNNPNGYPTLVNVDCSQSQGNVMRIEQANVHSTTSALPGEKARTWLQGFHHNTIRTWLALSTINKLGYNYKYEGGPTVETSLAYYSTCADSLLVALTAYDGSASSPMPPKGIALQNFIQQTIIYYKTKFPKIKYIEAGNEPDYDGQTVTSYYEYYQDYYKAVNAANTQLGLTGNNRILLSNAPFTSSTTTGGVVNYTFTNSFLALYAADPDNSKKLDFYSVHCYMGESTPIICKTINDQIINTMKADGLPAVPVFVTEYGMVGGDFIPSAWSEANIMTAWPAAQLSKAFYLYEGGINRVFNWCISHGSILHKSELADLTNAYPNPYGNALLFCKELSARVTRIKASSGKLSSSGLGINVLAAMGNGQGVAVLVWNYNYTNSVADQNINVQISNIPQAAFAAGNVHAKIYIIDSDNNNIFNNAAQNSLKTTLDATYNYSSSLAMPLKLQQNSVALIVLTP